MDIRAMRKRLGLSVPAFSKKYGIPTRTLESWELEERTPPGYVLALLESRVIQDITISDIAKECAEELDIKCPEIKLKQHDNILETTLAICREMRRVYQTIYNKQILDLQEAVIDANAYASIFIQKKFGVKPLFQDLPEPIRKKIEKRIDFLRKNA